MGSMGTVYSKMRKELHMLRSMQVEAKRITVCVVVEPRFDGHDKALSVKKSEHEIEAIYFVGNNSYYRGERDARHVQTRHRFQ